MIRVRGIVALAVGALLLAGCTAPSTSASPQASPSRTPGSPSPAPTASAPSFAGGAGCADILTLPQVQAQIAAPISVLDDENSAPENASQVAIRQAGGIDCVWGGTQRQDGEPTEQLSLDILPNAASELAAYARVDPSGVDNCQADELSFCADSFLVADAWVRLSYSEHSPSNDTPSAVRQRVATLKAIIDSRLRSIGTRNASWRPAAGALTGDDVCDAPTVAAALDQTVVPVGSQDPVVAASMDAVARSRTESVSCTWTGDLSAVVVPGGAWVAGAIQRHPPAPGMVPALTAIDTESTAEAWVGCGDACVADIVEGGSFLVLTGDSGDPSEWSAVVRRFVSAVSAL